MELEIFVQFGFINEFEEGTYPPNLGPLEKSQGPGTWVFLRSCDLRVRSKFVLILLSMDYFLS
jgi:hypothetical protein